MLVTGGSGFIGTHLCRALVQAGHENVRVLDVLEPRQRVQGVEYHRGDIRDAGALSRVMRGVDTVFHLAALVSVPLCQEKPSESYSTNVAGTIGVLEAAHAEGTRCGTPLRVVFSGSSVVYGTLGRAGEPVQEACMPDVPRSFYGAQKLAAEHAIRLFHESKGLPAVVFRFFNVYGHGQDPLSPYSGVISIFSEALRCGQALKLNGGGGQTRDFVSVRDVCAALVRSASLAFDACDAKAVNIGSGRGITIRDLAIRMSEVRGLRPRLEDAPAREGDVPHSLASIERARSLLDWQPGVELAEGLKDLLP
ncbi:MAG: hypothetical protein A2583_14525 [Bdellovibrionales bacterium RIFOXYD1_FULL_53_11]|nr:MAG: hypothetical protein A2583_14525 [Bdellovibrionales bacterium RIFOXYD1_FULL_53_11]